MSACLSYLNVRDLLETMIFRVRSWRCGVFNATPAVRKSLRIFFIGIGPPPRSERQTSSAVEVGKPSYCPGLTGVTSGAGLGAGSF